MPHSITLPIEGHTEQSERYKKQLAASIPLKKNLWQQTVEAKIRNQLIVLQKLDKPFKRLQVLLNRIQSGDPDNIEGQAAAYYWPTLIQEFKRDRYGEPPNNLLNYGYAILRAMVARAIVSSGLLPTLGIHHKNKYNAFCLADDIMEPYRPFIDLIVYNMFVNNKLESFLSTESKQHLLSIGEVDGRFGKKISPLIVGAARTTSSLYQCFSGEKRKIIYPMIV
jgi:CRISPR-associated protein Cas1